MRILLFGKTGQVGSALVPLLRDRGRLTALDREGSEGVSGDLSDPSAVAAAIRSLNPDLVVNGAAYTAVDRAEEEQEVAHKINAEAPGAMAEACRETGASLVHYSTDYVFSGNGSQPWREDDPVQPVNAYGQTKLAGEEAIRQSGCRYLIFRTSWVYAANGQNFLRTMLRLATERDALSVVDDQWGAPTGASLIAGVTVRMVELLNRKPGTAGLYHLAPAGETTWYRYACHAIERARNGGWPVRVDPEKITAVGSEAFPTAARRPLNSRLDCRKLERALGEPMPDWRKGVDEVVDQLVRNQPGEQT